MSHRVLLVVLLAVPLACASSGSTTNSEDDYPRGMLTFSRENPPECPYEEVVRLFRDAGIWYRGAPSARGYEGYELLLYGNSQTKRELQKTYVQYEADALIESVKRGGPTIGPMEQIAGVEAIGTDEVGTVFTVLGVGVLMLGVVYVIACTQSTEGCRVN